MKNLICPVSPERVDENVVRFTALWVVLLLGLFFLFPNPYIPVFLIVDFFIRAFTKARFSPLSYLSQKVVGRQDSAPKLIDKAPKIFAARIGLFFSALILILFIAGLNTPVMLAAGVLGIFAFLECGINFCAGCYVYTYLVYPLYH